MAEYIFEWHGQSCNSAFTVVCNRRIGSLRRRRSFGWSRYFGSQHTPSRGSAWRAEKGEWRAQRISQQEASATEVWSSYLVHQECLQFTQLLVSLQELLASIFPLHGAWGDSTADNLGLLQRICQFYKSRARTTLQIKRISAKFSRVRVP